MKSSNEIKKEFYNKGTWTSIEKEKFKEGLLLFGNNIKYLHNYIKSRSNIQIKAHLQKFFKSIKSKFKKELNKEISKNKNIEIYEYSLLWANNFLNDFFGINCPSENNFVKLNLLEKEYKENYTRIANIILLSIAKKNSSSKNKSVKTVIHRCSCNCWEKETSCDCFDDCCEAQVDDKAKKNLKIQDNLNLDEISVLAKNKNSQKSQELKFYHQNLDITIKFEDKLFRNSNKNKNSENDVENLENIDIELNSADNFDLFPKMTLFESKETSQISNYDNFSGIFD